MTRVIVIPINLDTHRESFDLFVSGDVHYAHPGCNLDSFERWIDAVLESVDRGRKTFSVLMGDYAHCFSKDDRRRNPSIKNLDPLKVYTEFRDIIRPVAPYLNTVLTGNHDLDWWINENIDFVNWMCAELRVEPGTFECYIRFKVRCGKSRRNIDVLAWHGSGSSRTRGGALNTAARPLDTFKHANISLMGHLHRLGMMHEQTLVPNEKTLEMEEEDQYIVLTGGYQKGYVPPRNEAPQVSTYIGRKMLPPVAIGGVKLRIQPFHKVGTRDVLSVSMEEIR